MFVLTEVEWICNEKSMFSLTQIAAMRVRSDWQSLARFAALLLPNKPELWRWEDKAFSGNETEAFLCGLSPREMFSSFSHFLRKDDILCFRSFEERGAFFHSCPNGLQNTYLHKSRILSDYLQDLQNGNKADLRILLPSFPEKTHEAKKDLKNLQAFLQTMHFPQKKLYKPSPSGAFWKNRTLLVLQDPLYSLVYSFNSNSYHQKCCSRLKRNETILGIRYPGGIGNSAWLPCSECIPKKAEPLIPENTPKISENSISPFIYLLKSPVFHRKTCRMIAETKNPTGTGDYKSCKDLGRRPCKFCQPDILDSKQADRVLNDAEKKALNRFQFHQKIREPLLKQEDLSRQERRDLLILTNPKYLFFTAKGCKCFHQQNCPRLKNRKDLRGFFSYKEALEASRKPCKCCKPNEKQKIDLFVPINSERREGESIAVFLKKLRQERFSDAKKR